MLRPLRFARLEAEEKREQAGLPVLPFVNDLLAALVRVSDGQSARGDAHDLVKVGRQRGRPEVVPEKSTGLGWAGYSENSEWNAGR